MFVVSFYQAKGGKSDWEYFQKQFEKGCVHMHIQQAPAKVWKSYFVELAHTNSDSPLVALFTVYFSIFAGIRGIDLACSKVRQFDKIGHKQIKQRHQRSI